MGNSLEKSLNESLGEYDIDYSRTITYVNGDVYTGDIEYNTKNKIKHGTGIMIYANGDVYDGQWKDDNRAGKGTIQINGVKLHCHWMIGLIAIINSVENPKNIVLDIYEIIPFFLHSTIKPYPIELYQLCGLVQTPLTIKSFTDKIKTDRRNIKLVVLCHGILIGPIPLTKPIHRINLVPLGVCSFTNTEESMDMMGLVTNMKSNQTNEQLKEVVKTKTFSVLKSYCEKLKHLDESTPEKQMVNACSQLTFCPELVTDKKIMNKTFTMDGPGINVLLLIDSDGNYINLFSKNQTSFTLEEILTYIPVCSDVTYIDWSCSDDREGKFTKEQLCSLGGKRKKSKKRKSNTLSRVFTRFKKRVQHK